MEPATTGEVIVAEEPVEARPALDDLVRLHWHEVFRFALASVRDADAAANIAQDCFLRADRGWARFRGDCTVRTWLMRIAVNLVRDYARNRSLQFWVRARASAVDIDRPGLSLAHSGLSPEALAVAREQVRAVWRATERLSQKQRTVFLLRFVEDMDLLEIAAVTGMKEGTVKVHLFRALQSVRERIQDLR